MTLSKETYQKIVSRYSSLLLTEDDAVDALDFAHDILNAEDRGKSEFIPVQEKTDISRKQIGSICFPRVFKRFDEQPLAVKGKDDIILCKPCDRTAHCDTADLVLFAERVFGRQKRAFIKRMFQDVTADLIPDEFRFAFSIQNLHENLPYLYYFVW